MTFLNKSLQKLKNRSGQSLVEYALILALVAVVAIVVLQGVGSGTNNKLANVNGNLQ